MTSPSGTFSFAVSMSVSSAKTEEANPPEEDPKGGSMGSMGDEELVGKLRGVRREGRNRDQ